MRGESGSGLRGGKIPAELLTELVAGLPSPPEEARLGPRVGEDACAIDVPAGTLIAATDPITLTGAEIGRFAVIVNANDVAVMGVRPRWFLAVLLLPPGATERQVRELFDSLQRGLTQVGVHLVGGHTEVTSAVTRPLVVGQMLGLAEDRGIVTTAGARPGDVLVQIGAAPVEGAAVLARELEARLAGLDPGVVESARGALDDPGISVVEPALVAAELGATSLHDPTEGGLAAGLHEVADAAGVAIRVDTGSVLWFAPGRAVCSAIGADPWATIASGALLAAFPPDRAEEALGSMTKRGYAAGAIARIEEGSGVRDTGGRPIPWPERDEVARLLARGT